MHDLKDRESMYKMIVSQLFYDGHQKDAMQLASTVGIALSLPPPSDKLFRVVSKFNDEDPEQSREREERASHLFQTHTLANGLDLECDADVIPNSAEPCQYETIYLTSHKGPCRAASFNNQGTLVATGSVDCSIKILDVERIINRELTADYNPNAETDGDTHPVIRTLYDHVEEVLCLAFHPRLPLLVSGSADRTAKFYDFTKSAVKRANKTIMEVEPVRCVSFHPGGEFLMLGTNHPTLRLYNCETSQCWTCNMPSDQHTSAINDVQWASTGRQFVSASRDGDVKIWDGVSNRCVTTFQRAHDGAEICSAAFTRNGKYVLTSGKDSVVKLWELAANRCLIAYTGAGATGQQENILRAEFNHTEDYVLFPDEKSGSLCSWDSRNADRKRLLALGHTSVVRAFAHSPTQCAFVTASEDYRARFWFRRQPTD